MKPVVLDTYALLAWINQETGYEAYRRFFTDNQFERFITPITLFELKLAFLRKGVSEEDQISIFAYVKAACTMTGVNEAVAMRAAEIRFKYLRNSYANLSMADSIAVALAEMLQMPLISGEKGLKHVSEVNVLP